MIGVVTTSYPRFPGDPAGSFVAGHVAALRALGHRVEVIAADDQRPARASDRAGETPYNDQRRARASDRAGETPYNDQRRARASDRAGETPYNDQSRDHRDATVHRVRDAGGLFYRGGAPDRLERAPLRGALTGAAFSTRLVAEVMRRAPRWELCIAHWLAPSALAALPARVPLLAIAHGGDVHTLRRLHLLAPALHALHARRARLVFVSDQLRQLACACVPSLARWLAGAVVQPMGIALDHFAAIPRAPSDPPALVVASRLVPVKGVDVAIAAMAHVHNPARLVIAGDGPARAELATRACDRVTFLGGVDTAARDRLLGSASVVVIPSRVLPGGRTEGTPMIALEALAAGVPVVASAVGGLRELAGPTLVPPEDPPRLARAIDRVLTAPASPETLRQAVAELDWSGVARRLLDAV